MQCRDASTALDPVMPMMNGCDVQSMIRENQATKDTPDSVVSVFKEKNRGFSRD